MNRNCSAGEMTACAGNSSNTAEVKLTGARKGVRPLGAALAIGRERGPLRLRSQAGLHYDDRVLMIAFYGGLCPPANPTAQLRFVITDLP